MMKKILLLTLAPLTLSLHAAFIMEKNKPLTKIQVTSNNEDITVDEEPNTQVALAFSKTEIDLGKTSLVEEDKHLAKRYTITAPYFKPTGWDALNIKDKQEEGVNWVKQYELRQFNYSAYWAEYHSEYFSDGSSTPKPYKERKDTQDFTDEAAKYGMTHQRILDDSGKILRHNFRLQPKNGTNETYRVEMYEYNRMKFGTMKMGLKIEKFKMGEDDNHVTFMQIHELSQGYPFLMVNADRYQGESTRRIYALISYGPGKTDDIDRRSRRIELGTSEELEAASPTNPVYTGIRLFKDTDDTWKVAIWVGSKMIEFPVPERWVDTQPYFKTGLYVRTQPHTNLEMEISAANVVKDYSEVMTSQPASSQTDNTGNYSDWQ